MMRRLSAATLVCALWCAAPGAAQSLWSAPDGADSPYRQGFEQGLEQGLEQQAAPPVWSAPPRARDDGYRFRPWGAEEARTDEVPGYRFREPGRRADAPLVVPGEGIEYRFRPLTERERMQRDETRSRDWRPRRQRSSDGQAPPPLGWPAPWSVD
ncbi:hypothetical protein [Marichromatium gracile]|uniref:Uncharacterized protein n=1 Tax=Marichromatium gracile TaxID=1048 RepID=A0A4R4A9G1_MARGR|nr:hypothetical protein [Marichromatium gracile]MBK1708538.1 hypothetical protein [Marichromatium gracile]TCW35571.1 hypothetical protein EDC29_106139 [Marichromatium gracile]